MKKTSLYRVARSKGQFIMEVPLIYTELNDSDSFVLVKNADVYSWNSFHSNEHKIRRAKSFCNRIIRLNRTLYSSKPMFTRVTGISSYSDGLLERVGFQGMWHEVRCLDGRASNPYDKSN